MHLQIDIQLETGEYFLNEKKKSAKKWQDKQEKQAEKTADNKRKREAAFVPPKVYIVWLLDSAYPICQTFSFFLLPYVL